MENKWTVHERLAELRRGGDATYNVSAIYKNSRSLRLSTLSGRWYRSRIAEYADPGYGENAGTSDQENPG
jgi:hypothetical protein